MATILSLPKLYQAVIDRFTAEGTHYVQSFGWREPGLNHHDVTHLSWVPGLPKTGDMGKVVAARQTPYGPGAPKALANLEELFHVEMTTSDTTDPENELKQYIAARLVYDAWYRAVHKAVHGTFVVVSSTWMNTRNLRRNGAGIQVVVGLLAVLPDQIPTLAPTDARARIAVKELDVTETIVVQAPPPEEP